MSVADTPAFHYVDLDGWRVGRFAALENADSLVHAVTTRQGPDVKLMAADPAAGARAMAGKLALDGVAWCRQVHGCQILAAYEPGCAGECDGLVTGVSSLGLMICGADCPLILAYDQVSGAIGVAHASWRGTVGRIASNLVLSLAGRFRARPEDVIACIGPSAGPCCYEVGQDVREAARGGIGRHADRFFEQRDAKTYFDLWAANTDELLRAGVLPSNVHVAGQCTICNNDVFPSRRAEGESAGRFAAVLAVR